MCDCCQNTRLERFTALDAILEAHGHRSERLVPILQAAQETFRYLPREVMAYIARDLRLPPAKVYGVATFYAHFALSPKGKHVVRLCDGTACHVKRSIPILDALRANLGLSESKNTTDDQLFTVETVSCLGACGLAPVMLINEAVHGQVTPEQAVDLVNAIAAEEKTEDIPA
ncbi:MAG: NAD(P)H-dependent oxidoreductase subunit E [Planctomycetota bacterium]